MDFITHSGAAKIRGQGAKVSALGLNCAKAYRPGTRERQWQGVPYRLAVYELNGLARQNAGWRQGVATVLDPRVRLRVFIPIGERHVYARP